MKVTVIDSMMGRGKTSYAIQMMNTAPKEQKFLFITPYLAEAERIEASVTTRKFIKPKAIKGLKLEGLKKLLRDGVNIASTHALFRKCDREVLDLLQMQDYTLVLDEVIEIIEPVDVVKKDMDALLNEEFISISETGLVTWIEDMDYYGSFKKFKDYAVNGNLFFVKDSLFMWSFPADIFNAFKEVYILTYMFDGQFQKAYFDLFGVEYDYKSVEKVGDSYRLVDYANTSRRDIQPLINIYEGDLNTIGKDFYALSATKQRKFKTKKHVAELIKRNTYNYFNNKVKGKSNLNMWTCLKEIKPLLSGNGYSKGYVSNNCRATNEYSHKTNLAYIYNKFVDGNIQQFFNKNNTKMNEDLYAISELVQWIWRSAIRNGQPINLYIPSSRMRELLYLWLNDMI